MYAWLLPGYFSVVGYFVDCHNRRFKPEYDVLPGRRRCDNCGGVLLYDRCGLWAVSGK